MNMNVNPREPLGGGSGRVPLPIHRIETVAAILSVTDPVTEYESGDGKLGKRIATQLERYARLVDHSREARKIASTLIPDAMDMAVADALAYAERDPEKHGDVARVIHGSRPFKAVMLYRFAHRLHERGHVHMAGAITWLSTVVSGAEIHQASDIGERFVLDHAFGTSLLVDAGNDLYVLEGVRAGTVVGEHAVVGDDCYIGYPCVLGALRIGEKPDVIRHPRLGDRVQLFGGSTVVGPISVGSDVQIHRYATVCGDLENEVHVHANSHVHVGATVRRGAIVGSGCCIRGEVPPGIHVPEGARWPVK